MVGMFGAGAGGWVTPSWHRRLPRDPEPRLCLPAEGCVLPFSPWCLWAAEAARTSRSSSSAGGLTWRAVRSLRQAARRLVTKRHSGRRRGRRREGRQSAVAEVPAAVAAPAGAAACPQGREGSKVRPPDRKPRESGDTPGGKVTRSDEPSAASFTDALAAEGPRRAGGGAAGGMEHCRQEQAQSRGQAYHMLVAPVVGRGEHTGRG